MMQSLVGEVKLKVIVKFLGPITREDVVLEVQSDSEIKEKIKVDFEIKKVDSIYKEGEYWVVGEFKSKNVILATGHKSLIDIPYINIRPIWGERIEGIENGELRIENKLFHKNCSVGIIDGVIKIGATHKRNCLECRENEEEA